MSTTVQTFHSDFGMIGNESDTNLRKVKLQEHADGNVQSSLDVDKEDDGRKFS